MHARRLWAAHVEASPGDSPIGALLDRAIRARVDETTLGADPTEVQVAAKNAPTAEVTEA